MLVICTDDMIDEECTLVSCLFQLRDVTRIQTRIGQIVVEEKREKVKKRPSDEMRGDS